MYLVPRVRRVPIHSISPSTGLIRTSYNVRYLTGTKALWKLLKVREGGDEGGVRVRAVATVGVVPAQPPAASGHQGHLCSTFQSARPLCAHTCACGWVGM